MERDKKIEDLHEDLSRNPFDRNMLQNFYYKYIRYYFNRIILYPLQKLFRGYSDKDLWNVDYSLGMIIVKYLKAFKKSKRNSYPSCFNNMEEWEEVLDDMIYAFDYLANVQDKDMEIWNECGCKIKLNFSTKENGEDFIQHESSDETFENYKRISEKKYDEAKKKAQLFIEHFNSLWD